jgi:hypothetical protein
MAWEDMELRGPEERRASKLHIPPGLSRGPLKFTVPEDEFRVGCHRLGGLMRIRRPQRQVSTLTGSAGVNRRKRLAQGIFLYFSHGVARQLLDQENPFRHFVAR